MGFGFGDMTDFIVEYDKIFDGFPGEEFVLRESFEVGSDLRAGKEAVECL